MIQLKLFFNRVGKILKPFLLMLLSKTGQLVLTLAVEVVKDLATQDLSSSDKREMAFNQIEEKLKGKGMEVQASLINGAIEAAVQYIK